MSDFYGEVKKWAKDAGASSFFVDQFFTNLYEFIDYLTELNEYIGVTAGGGKSYPVEPMMISMVKHMLKSSLSCSKSRRKIMKHILAKINQPDICKAIVDRNPAKLSELGHLIFDDLPKSISNSIVEIINNDHLDEDTYSCVFDYIDSLVVNLLKSEATLEKYKGDDNILVFINEKSKYNALMVAFFPKF